MKEEKPSIEALCQKEAYSNRVCDLVKTLASSYYELPLSAYQSKSRVRQVIKMKQASVYFMRKLLPKATLLYIGRQMQYDHATVLHCVKVINNLLETDKETRMDIQALSKNIELETDLIRLDGKVNSEYHYINLDNCNSFKFADTRGIVLSNFDDDQIEEFKAFVQSFYKFKPERHTHINTGLFIIEKNKTIESEESQESKNLINIIDTENEPNIIEQILDKQ